MARPRAELALLAIPLVAVLTAAACSSSTTSDGSDAGACSPDLGAIQSTIFDKRCATSGCHDEGGRAGGLVLAKGRAEAELVGRSAGSCDGVRVVPGSPDTSVLVRKLTAGAGCGERMPLGGAELSTDQKACIRQWIASLTPDGGPGPGDGGDASCGDTRSNPSHCGSCGTKCPPGASCADGACRCPSPLSACGTTCADTQTSAAHCGKCGQACPTGARCAGGECACPAGPDGAPLAVCDGRCVDVSSDGAHCGGCKRPCGGDTPVCIAGACAADCGALTKCGASCVDTSTSFAHCGGCDAPCAAGATCVGGSCACPASTTACGGVCIPTDADPNNCGACGRTCGSGTVCTGGACVCPGGGKVCAGACTDTQTDPANCGDCGRACITGQTCRAGACGCTGVASVSFAADVQPIFTAACAQVGCHAGGAPREGLNLAAGRAYGSLVNVPANQCADGRLRVVPGEPANSYLIHKLVGIPMCSGSLMPRNGGDLPAAQLATLTSWICNGAENN